jgi:alpha-L-rhamnosidase
MPHFLYKRILASLVGLGCLCLLDLSSHAAPAKTPWIQDPTYGLPIPHLTPPKTAALTAHWIWQGPVAGDQQVAARTVFTLDSAPRQAEVWATGDDAVSVFINGHLVEQTQSVEMGWSHPSQRSVASYLHRGKNILALLGVNRGGGAAGMLAELIVDGAPVVATGSHWKALLLTTPPQGWQEPAFDDSAWHSATDEGAIGTGVWGGGVTGWLGASAGAWYMAHRTMRPVAVESLGSGQSPQNLDSLRNGAGKARVVIGGVSDASQSRQILLDFGRELSGCIEVAGTDGASVQVHTGESRDAALRILTDARLIGIDNSGPWTLTLHGSDVQTTPYTAFRYALITFPGNQPVTLTQADCDFKYYPVRYQGTFACSDPLLTRIWYTGAYTAHLCMQEDIWDAPKRDRGLWIGDLHVSGETINNVFLDKFLMEKTIAGGRAAAQGGRPDTAMPTADINNIPGYTAAWFGVLADFYRHVGDNAFLQSQHANILSLLAYQQTEFNAQNLFDNPTKEWDFCDWAPGYVEHTPQTLATTDLFDVYGIHEAVFLLRALGDTANAAKYAAWAEALTEAARAHLADSAAQTYGDRVQENAMAVDSGVATPTQQTGIYDAILQAGTPAWQAHSAGDLSGSEVISPYYGNYVLQAYAYLDKYQAGIDLIRRYWGAMLARGTMTWWEEFDPSFPPDMNVILGKMPYLSLCHGWSSGPTSFLTEHILGVQPTSGGFQTVTIQPELGDLAWVSGTVPTPHGPIFLRVDKSGPGMVCHLTLPAGIHTAVTLSGRTVTLDHAGQYTLRSDLVSQSGGTPGDEGKSRPGSYYSRRVSGILGAESLCLALLNSPK